MNEVYEHNAGVASVRNFYDKYRNYIVIIATILIFRWHSGTYLISN